MFGLAVQTVQHLAPERNNALEAAAKPYTNADWHRFSSAICSQKCASIWFEWLCEVLPCAMKFVVTCLIHRICDSIVVACTCNSTNADTIASRQAGCILWNMRVELKVRPIDSSRKNYI